MPKYSAQNGLPNVIIIFTDDLGYGDLSCYGHPTIRTPNLDVLAREGTRFTQFYVAASVCTPSRAALLTGKYPVRTDVSEASMPGRVLFPTSQNGLPQSEFTIAELFRQRDYATMAIGKWHLGHLPEYLPTSHGFDTYYGVPYSNDMDHVGAKDGNPAYWNIPLMKDTLIIERPADQTSLTRRYTEESIRFINKHRQEPFFLYLAHTMPHVPLFASGDFAGTSARGLYGDVVEEIDWSIGEIIRTLKDLQIDNNTLVVFTSDNGPWLVQKENGGSAGLLRDGKGTTWEGGMRVPMIAWWPGHIPGGKVSEALTSSLDILPTMAELINGTLSDQIIDGTSILSVLKGEDLSPRQWFGFFRGDDLFALRYGPWKAHYITQTAYPAGPKQIHDPPLLYQLDKDPSEHFDVAGDHPDVIKEINAIADQLRESTHSIVLPTLEAEDHIDLITVTGGHLRVQDMRNFNGDWGNDKQLWWVEASPGDVLTIPITVETPGTYKITGFFTRAKDYGIIRLFVNGQPVGALMDGYGAGIEHTGPLLFGSAALHSGENTIALEIVGKDIRAAGYSDGYLVGIDGFLLH